VLFDLLLGIGFIVAVQYTMPFIGQHDQKGALVSRPSQKSAFEPTPADPHLPRYSTRPWPAYRFVPGASPHPRRHPTGHSYGQQEPAPSALAPNQWQANDLYLFGVDLYNFAFWWECHEIFEGFWRAAGVKSEQGRFFHALIHVAAANLKGCMGRPSSADRLSKAALERFQVLPQMYMGLDVRMFERDVHAYANGFRVIPALIRLQVSPQLRDTED
jgi:uncharacterized protein